MEGTERTGTEETEGMATEITEGTVTEITEGTVTEITEGTVKTEKQRSGGERRKQPVGTQSGVATRSAPVSQTANGSQPNAGTRLDHDVGLARGLTKRLTPSINLATLKLIRSPAGQPVSAMYVRSCAW